MYSQDQQPIFIDLTKNPNLYKSLISSLDLAVKNGASNSKKPQKMELAPPLFKKTLSSIHSFTFKLFAKETRSFPDFMSFSEGIQNDIFKKTRYQDNSLPPPP